MSVEDLLGQIEDLLDEGKPALMSSGKVRVDSEAIRRIIDEIKLIMPEEVRQARKIASERKEILEKAQAVAAARIKQGELQANQMVEEHEITKAAQQNAAQIISEARGQSADIIEKAKASSAEIINNAQKWAGDLRTSASNFVESVMNESESILTKSMEDFAVSLNKVRAVNQQLHGSAAKNAENE